MIFHILPISILSFILVFTLLSTSLPDETELHATCSKPFQCANFQNIGYPFWGGDRSKLCGHPNFELNCKNKDYSQIMIESSTYRVLSINNTESSLTVVQSEFWDSFCPSTPSNATLDTSYLTYALSSENITLYYGCLLPNALNQFDCRLGGSNTTSFYWTQNHPSNIFNLDFKACRTNVVVQVSSTSAEALSSNPPSINISTALRSGFELVWDANNDDCIKCVQSGGACGSNPNSTSFLFSCFCSDRAYEVSCNDSEKGDEKEIGRSFTKMKTKEVIIGVCSIIGLLLLVIAFWCFRNVVTKEIRKRRKKKFFKQNGGLLLQQQLISSDCNVEKIKVFKSYELENATNHYNVDRVIGQGGQGIVYKGILPDGRLIAVKKSKIVDPSNVGQFINEVVILSQINHRNIVKLLGCCFETEVPMLAYEFISNGTLYQHIQNPKEEFRFTWEMRLRIAAEIAGTLSYLHNAAPVPIYHRDIKSTNILLDDKYHAKVSDFGISRSVNIDISHLTTLVRGTFGYLDPEYYQSSRFTEKSDVYSFGVVLVELMTGQKPIFSNTSQEFKGLVPYFVESMEENHFLDMIDPQLSKEDKIEEMVEVAHLAKACLNSIGKRRPTMKEVTLQLEGIRMSREQTMSRENDGIDHGKAYDSSNSTGAWSESSATSSLNVDLSIELKDSIKIASVSF